MASEFERDLAICRAARERSHAARRGGWTARSVLERVDEDTLYRLETIGHEDYSTISLLEDAVSTTVSTPNRSMRLRRERGLAQSLKLRSWQIADLWLESI